MHLNFTTALAGFVKVGAWDHEGRLLRSFDDCDALSGNHLDCPVTWGGQADLGHAEGSPVTLRFQPRSARLFSAVFR